MPSPFAPRRDAATVAVVGGLVHAVAVLSWLFSAGVSVSSRDPATFVVGVAYAVAGTFLMGAVPLYLLGRLSLVSAPLASLWILGDTAYQWRYGAHLHPLSSYLTVWPLLLGVTLAVAGVEALVRTGLDRTVGRFGLRRLL